MERRTFTSVTGGLLAGPLTAEAHQQGEVCRIGYIDVSDDIKRYGKIFQRLRERRYLEGLHAAFEETADGSTETHR